MNPLWKKARDRNLLKTIYAVLADELKESKDTKNAELARFKALASDPIALSAYEKNAGFTKDACERVLSNIVNDEGMAASLNHDVPENALYGDDSLKKLYPGEWKNVPGRKPTDVIVLCKDNPLVALGDCKFGMISEDSGLLRDTSRLQSEFLDKFSSVCDFIKNRDGVDSSSKKYFIVTSALAPLLKNRIDDYKLDSHYKDIPLDDIVFCCVADIVAQLRGVISFVVQ